MDICKKRSLSESSTEDEEEEQRKTVIVPKKRKWIESTSETAGSPIKSASSESSNDEDEPDYKRRASVLRSSKSSIDYYGLAETKKKSGAITSMNDVAMKMMASMGYKAGEGLGKYGQGRKEIIETSNQRGRRGLGMTLKGLEPCNIEWDFKKEHVSVCLDITWIPQCTEDIPSMVELRTWMTEGNKKEDISDETLFCDPEVLKNVLSCKDVFDRLEPEEMKKARLRSNPFETIRGVFFQNRAALKMAEMDASFDFMFTSPKDEYGKPTVKSKELLYFADVCAGPGGFSEYVLWRKKWLCKGFGFTLKGQNDFKLEEFFAGTPETFEPHYGVNGITGNGDIFVPENLREFRRFVLESTEDKGVHFVMADGGFSVEGKENIQEILSKRLYLCQFLCALSILRPGGHFVCKVFDLFTPFSVGLVYLLYRAFQMVCILKPNTSRPANSERYVVCKWKRENASAIQDYMFEVNCRLKELATSQTDDVTDVVPLEIIKDDQSFFDYIVNSNNILGERQIISLVKIRAFTQDTGLHENRQTDLRSQCLKMWQIPDQMRSNPARPEPLTQFKNLIQDGSSDYFGSSFNDLDEDKLQLIESIYDYRCLVYALPMTKDRSDRAFFLGLGRSHVFQWDGTSVGRWCKSEITLELPAGTLLYAEIVPELMGEGRAQRKIHALHVIDALFLGGKDVRDKHYTERMSQAQLLVTAVSKPSRPEISPIRTKEVYRFEEICQIFKRLEMRIVKGGANNLRLCYRMENGRHYLPSGLLILKTVEEPWIIAYSKSSKRKYYFNKKTAKSTFECEDGMVADFRSTFLQRISWAWEPGVKIMDTHDEQEGKVHQATIVKFVQSKLKA